MIEVGCCASMIDPQGDPIGIEAARDARAAGFDYIELSLRDLAALDESGFARVQKKLDAAGIPCRSFNNFMPPRLCLAGEMPCAPGQLDEYLNVALPRARALGGEVIVLGSPRSRDMYFSPARARAQYLYFMKHMGPMAREHGLTICMENIARQEANILNTLEQSLQFVEDAADAGIEMMADYCQYRLENGRPEQVLAAGAHLKHVHFSRLSPRLFPKRLEEDQGYAPFLGALKQMRYAHRISVESYTASLVSDGRESIRLLRDFFREEQAQ